MANKYEDYATGKAETAPGLSKLIPPERPSTLFGVERAGYQLYSAWSEDYQGIAQVDGGAAANTIRFQVEAADSAIDLSKSFVSVAFKVEIQGGSPAAWGDVSRDQPASLRNGGGSLLFQRTDIRINNTKINNDCCAADDGEGWSAFIQAITREQGGYGRSKGPARLWVPTARAGAALVFGEGESGAANGGTAFGMYSSSAGHNEISEEGWNFCDAHTTNGNPLALNIGENTVWPINSSRGAGNVAIAQVFDAECVVKYRPATGLWRQSTALPPGCRLDLTLHRSRCQRFIQSEAYAAATAGRFLNVRVTVYRATLWLYRIKPTQEIADAIASALKKEQFFLPFTARRIWNATIPTGTRQWQASGLFPGQMPTRVFIGLSRAFRQSGLEAQLLSSAPSRFRPWGTTRTARMQTAVVIRFRRSKL